MKQFLKGSRPDPVSALAVLPGAPAASLQGAGVLSGAFGEVSATTRAGPKVVVTGAGLTASLGNDTPAVEGYGLLVEAAHTNLALNSDTLENWDGFNASVTTNAGVGPDGVAGSARKLVEDNTNNAHQWYQNVTTPSGTCAFSATVKAAERTWCFLNVNSSGFNKCWFNLATGEVGSSVGSATGYIRALGNGWYRVSLVTTNELTSGFFIINPATADGVSSYLGDGTSGILLHDVDVVAGGMVQSHVVTTASSVASVADVVTFSSAALPIASGSARVTFTPQWATNTNTPVLVETRTGSANVGICIDITIINGLRFQVGGTTQCSATISPAPGVPLRVQMVWGPSGTYGYVNDALVASNAAAPTLASHGTLHLGTDYTGAGQANGWLSDFQVTA